MQQRTHSDYADVKNRVRLTKCDDSEQYAANYSYLTTL